MFFIWKSLWIFSYPYSRAPPPPPSPSSRHQEREIENVYGVFNNMRFKIKWNLQFLGYTKPMVASQHCSYGDRCIDCFVRHFRTFSSGMFLYTRNNKVSEACEVTWYRAFHSRWVIVLSCLTTNFDSNAQKPWCSNCRNSRINSSRILSAISY